MTRIVSVGEPKRFTLFLTCSTHPVRPRHDDGDYARFLNGAAEQVAGTLVAASVEIHAAQLKQRLRAVRLHGVGLGTDSRTDTRRHTPPP